MKINMSVKVIETNKVFDETYDIPNDSNPTEWANELVNQFNTTLRPKESPRELVSVSIVEKISTAKHNHEWEKQNLFTNTRNGSSYDTMRCSRCGISAKRYGLDRVVRDAKYKAKVYDTCEGSIEQLQKLAIRRSQ